MKTFMLLAVTGILFLLIPLPFTTIFWALFIAPIILIMAFAENPIVFLKRFIMFFVVSAGLLYLFAEQAQAKECTIKYNNAGCITESTFDSFISRQVDGDRRGMALLLGNGYCHILKKGQTVRRISCGSGWLCSTEKIRTRNNLHLVVAMEALSCK